MSVRTIVRRACFLVAYGLYARPKLGRTDRTRLFGFSLRVPPGVFHPRLYFSSKTLGGYLDRLALDGMDLLDVGCGSGILSLVAARRGASVTATDINPQAVDATRENALRNKLRVHALLGNLFEPLEEGARFDYVVFNPPFYRGEPGDLAEMAWHGGEDYRVIRDFLGSVSGFLKETGKIVLILSSDMALPRIDGIFHAAGFSLQCVHSEGFLFERLSIHQACRKS